MIRKHIAMLAAIIACCVATLHLLLPGHFSPKQRHQAEVNTYLTAKIDDLDDQESLVRRFRETVSSRSPLGGSPDEKASNREDPSTKEHFSMEVETELNAVRSMPVTFGQSRRVAEAFLSSEIKRGAQGVAPAGGYALPSNVRILDTQAINDTDALPLAFVHHLEPTGFIITSANTGIQPVIAFSFRDTCSVEDHKDNIFLKFLKTDMHARIRLLRDWDDIAVRELARSNSSLWSRLLQD